MGGGERCVFETKRKGEKVGSEDKEKGEGSILEKRWKKRVRAGRGWKEIVREEDKEMRAVDR